MNASLASERRAAVPPIGASTGSSSRIWLPSEPGGWAAGGGGWAPSLAPHSGQNFALGGPAFGHDLHFMARPPSSRVVNVRGNRRNVAARAPASQGPSRLYIAVPTTDGRSAVTVTGYRHCDCRQ